MSLKLCKYLSIFFVCFITQQTIIGQTKTQLQNKKKKLQKEINYTNQLINKNKKKQDFSLKQLDKLNANIETRTELINNFTLEIGLIAEEINLNEDQITMLEDKLMTLRKSYSKMVYNTWKTRKSLSIWMYIFSANNFNKAIRRYRYFKQVNELRVIQAKSIDHSKNELILKINLLKNSKTDKEIVIEEKNNELAFFELDKKEKDGLLKTLKKKEKDLSAKVKTQEQERDNLSKKINSIIDNLIPVKKKEKKTTTKTNTTNITKSNTTNTKGNTNLSGFESNKGLLGWPVDKGVVTGKFGVHMHPVLDKVEVKNDGIDISTDKGAKVKAVYKGTVSGVFKVDGFENVVIIRHGDYLTVYSHLSNVLVSKGIDISTNEKIGTAATNEAGDTYINFQVRFGSIVQNPNSWLSK